MPAIEPEEEISLIGILGEMTAQMAEAVTALVSERAMRDAARDAAIDALDHISAKAPSTDPVVTAGLERIVSLLRQGGARCPPSPSSPWRRRSSRSRPACVIARYRPAFAAAPRGTEESTRRMQALSANLQARNGSGS